jgi:hypothetical protein
LVLTFLVEKYFQIENDKLKKQKDKADKEQYVVSILNLNRFQI